MLAINSQILFVNSPRSMSRFSPISSLFYHIVYYFFSEKRQTMLFSATATKKTEDLVKLALKKEPISIGLDEQLNSNSLATVSGLEQGYVICPSDKRLLLLFTFLKKNRKKKVMVFFSSCMSVKYHNELLNYIDLSVMCIHVST